MTIRLFRRLIAAGLLAATAACASMTPYQAERYGYGFTEPVIEDDVYKVTFRGNANTPRSTVEDYLLLRMAELTRDEGFYNFWVQEQGTDCFITVRTSPTSECTIHRSHTEVFPYYSIERDPRWFWQSRSKKEYEAIAFFKMSNAEAGLGQGQNYAANDVIERLSELKN